MYAETKSAIYHDESGQCSNSEASASCCFRVVDDSDRERTRLLLLSILVTSSKDIWGKKEKQRITM